VLPYGQAISRTTYSALFALCGTAFGSGDGSTTFNIPDLRGRLPVGKDDMGGSAANRVTAGGSSIAGTTIGATGGAETVTLTTPQIPAHQHNVYLKDPGHLHQSRITDSGGAGVQSGGGLGNQQNQANTTTNTTGITIGSVNGTANDNQTAATGGGGAHTNMPPAIIVPWILRVI
jgi:microcystin-dependent protein